MPATDDPHAAAARGMATYFAAALVALLVLAAPAAATTGEWGSVAAWAFTFGPGAIVVLLAPRFRDPRFAIPFVLCSTTFRMVVAGLGGALVLWAVPATPRTVFLVWLGGMYLLALGLEIYLTMSINSLWTLARPGLHGTSTSAQLREAGR